MPMIQANRYRVITLTETTEVVPILLLSFTLALTFITLTIVTAEGSTEGSSDIPRAVCITNDKEYPMMPYFVKDKGSDAASVIRFPKLAGESRPDLAVMDGQRVTIELDEKPSTLIAVLVDTDSDDVTAELLENVAENTFEVSSKSPGAKSLQALATFDDGREISYTILLEIDNKEDLEDPSEYSDSYLIPTN